MDYMKRNTADKLSASTKPTCNTVKGQKKKNAAKPQIILLLINGGWSLPGRHFLGPKGHSGSVNHSKDSKKKKKLLT